MFENELGAFSSFFYCRSGQTFVCVNNQTLVTCVSRSVPARSLHRLPHAAGRSLRGRPLPGAPAGCAQSASDHGAQPCSRSGLLPSSATPVYEHEHELHRLLPQVRTTRSASSTVSIYSSLICCHPFFPAPPFLRPPLATLQLHQEQWQQRSQPSPTLLQPQPLLCSPSPAPWSGCRVCPTIRE